MRARRPRTGGWMRAQTRHSPINHRERADRLADLLRAVLVSYRDTLDLHSVAVRAETDRILIQQGIQPAAASTDAGDCHSCRIDLEILERSARDLGVPI